MWLLFSAAVFLSAALIFLVEPMFARMILPMLGGTPAVWNTCVVFYQSLLFAGYAYAHLAARRLPPRLQAVSHLGWLVAGLLVLPIAVGPGWTPPAGADPVWWMFLLLLARVGLPFFVLASTGPLLQHWLGALDDRGSSNPYRLYAASNVGSLLALLAYPLIVEPTLRLRAQSLAWTGLYVTLIAVVAACAIRVWRLSPRPAPLTPASTASLRASTASDWSHEPSGWLALAAVPSSLMLSVTTYISTDIAAVPLLWIVPLSLYLFTFILAFAERQWIPSRLQDLLFPVAAIGIVALTLARNTFPVRITAGGQLACFFVVALYCHQRLAASRPPVARLTEFYLWVSAGGAVGGLLTTLVAPLLFVGALEYPLVAACACLFLPGVVPAATKTWRRIAWPLAAVLPALLATILVRALRLVESQLSDTTTMRYLFVFMLPLAACYALQRRPRLMALALALLLVSGPSVRFSDNVTLFVERTFYGEHRVLLIGTERLLMSGTTNHGTQSVKPALACEPLSYYSRGGPVGQLFERLAQRPSTTRFGVIGLGTGSLAAYASPAQSWTFFEINPAIERVARNPEYFSYLRDCAPQANVVLGDARLSLERAADGSFDALFVDAFTSDAVPVHLMTTEAVGLYFRKLAPDGVLAMNITNRYLELTPVVAGVARAAGLAGVVQQHRPTAEELRISSLMATARWALLARRAEDLPAPTGSEWEPLDAVPGQEWTDDYSNVFKTVRW